MTIYTVGHSTHDLSDFIEILKAYKIETIVDIRSLPGSNRFPQYNREELEKSLPKEGIAYLHIKNLGGLRKGSKESINMGWRNKSFRNYADYMQTDEFKDGIKELLSVAKESTTCIMCAEAVPWRCHRSLIGDALLVRKIKVINIFSKTNEQLHKLTPFAKVKGKIITYPTELVDNKNLKQNNKS